MYYLQATFEGWMEVMIDAVDSRVGVSTKPEKTTKEKF